jgi:hypothetical protein
MPNLCTTVQHLTTHMCRQRSRYYSKIATKIAQEYKDFLKNCHHKGSLHRFLALMFFVKALRQLRQILEAMKQLNVNYGKKNEVMKR